MPERTALKSPEGRDRRTPGPATPGRRHQQLPVCWPPAPGDSDEAWDEAATVLAQLGAKWVLRVMRALQSGPLRHNELMRALARIHPTVLADTLRRMQAAGLIDRHVDPGPPARVSYQLTSLAHDALPLVTLLSQWAVEHSAQMAGHEPWHNTPLTEAKALASTPM